MISRPPGDGTPGRHRCLRASVGLAGLLLAGLLLLAGVALPHRTAAGQEPNLDTPLRTGEGDAVPAAPEPAPAPQPAPEEAPPALDFSTGAAGTTPGPQQDLGVALPASEDEAPPFILVVDIQEALSRSNAMESVQAELQELRRSYQEEFVALEQEFRGIEQQLLEQSEDLGEVELQDRRREFELRVAEAQHEVQDRRMALDRGQADAVEQIRTAMLEIVAEIAEDHGARLVLAKNQVVMVDRTLDITAEVVERLNQRLPTVDVVVETE
jgi:outer membrane protein